MRKLFVAGIVLFVLAGVAVAQTAPATPVDTAAVSNAIKDLKTAETQLAAVDERLYADIDVIAGILTKCGYALPALTGTPGTSTFVNERAARAEQIMSYCGDPATVAKVKPALTDGDRQALSNVRVDLLGLQGQLPPILGTATGAYATLQNGVLALPAMIAGGAAAGDVEGLSKLLGEATTGLSTAMVLPTNANKTQERINKLLGFVNMLL